MIFTKFSKLLITLGGICVFVFMMQCAPALQRPAISQNETQWHTVQNVLENNFKKLRTLKGQGKLIVETQDVSYNANAQIVFKNPDSVLIKVEAIFGIDVGSLFADRKAFKVYIPSHNTCYFGKSESLEKNQLIAFFIPPNFGQKSYIQNDGFYVFYFFVSSYKLLCSFHYQRVQNFIKR